MIAEALRLLRVYHRFSQSELSTDLHISKSYLCEIEAGKKKVFLEILNQYSKKFEVPVSSLLFFAESLEPLRPARRGSVTRRSRENHHLGGSWPFVREEC